MLSLAVTVILGIAMYCAGCNGQWGSVAIGGVILVIVWGLHAGFMADSEAYVNWRNYWKDRR